MVYTRIMCMCVHVRETWPAPQWAAARAWNPHVKNGISIVTKMPKNYRQDRGVARGGDRGGWTL